MLAVLQPEGKFPFSRCNCTAMRPPTYSQPCTGCPSTVGIAS